MVGLLLTNTFLQCCIGKSCFISEGLVKFDDEIVFEIVRYTAAVFGRITDNFVFFRDHFDIGTFVKRIHYDIRMFIFRESKTKHGGTICRCQLGLHIMFRQIDFVVIRFCDLTFVREPAGTFILVKFRSADNRHDRKLPVIIDPGAWLMSLFKTAYFISGIGISPSVPHLTGLRCPEIHTPRTCYSRIGVTGR